MKSFAIILFILSGVLVSAQAIGLTLEPGETARIGHTIVTCTSGEAQLSPCGVSNKGCFVGQLRVIAGDQSLECQSESDALLRIGRFKELGVCL